jgi:hypothetical protein
MECRGRLDWRNCRGSEQDETRECEAFQQLFRPFADEIEKNNSNVESEKGESVESGNV